MNLQQTAAKTNLKDKYALAIFIKQKGLEHGNT